MKGNNEGFFSKLLSGLSKTRDTITSRVEQLLKLSGSIDNELFEELEEILITSDVGVKSTTIIINKLRKYIEDNKVKDPMLVKGILKNIINEILTSKEYGKEEMKYPVVLMVVGVNGVGKTTTIGKLGHKFKSKSLRVLMAAGDTFRAAAIDQLSIWGNRSGIEVIKQQEGSDPAAVIYDAVQAAKSRKSDVLICDTAGRLHNKKNLMEELKKVNRVIDREFPECYRETLLVLDATTGQNAVLQAKEFKDACNITGLVLTKLDGTAKGGIIIAIKEELDVPVKYIGVGEGIEDLQEFDSESFVDALFGDVK